MPLKISRTIDVEQGIKFLINAFFDKDFYKDSLDNFLKAEKIEPTDFFVLHKIGLIYVHSPESDIEKAEEYFKKAAKYAVVETNSGAILTHNYLDDKLTENLHEKKSSLDAIKLQAAESYMWAGRCCYIQGKMDEASEFAGKGFNLVPQFAEAGFTQAKALAAGNNETKASIVLEKVINTDRFYSLKTLEDLDLCPKPAIQNVLKKLKKEATEKAFSLLIDCKSKMIGGSSSKEYLDNIELILNENTFLTSMKAIDLMEKVNIWNYCDPYQIPYQSTQLNELVKIINSINTLIYYKDGNAYVNINTIFIDTFIKNVTQETQWEFPLSSLIIGNTDWTSKIKSKEIKTNVIQFIYTEKSFNDNLPNVIKKFKDLLQEFENENTKYLDYLEDEKTRAENERIKYINGIEKAKQDKENENIRESIATGVFGGLIGAFIGWIVGGILGWIVSGLFYNESAIAKDNAFYKTMFIVILICFILGFITGYLAKREDREGR